MRVAELFQLPKSNTRECNATWKSVPRNVCYAVGQISHQLRDLLASGSEWGRSHSSAFCLEVLSDISKFFSKGYISFIDPEVWVKCLLFISFLSKERKKTLQLTTRKVNLFQEKWMNTNTVLPMSKKLKKNPILWARLGTQWGRKVNKWQKAVDSVDSNFRGEKR